MPIHYPFLDPDQPQLPAIAPHVASYTVDLLVANAHDALDANADRDDILQSIAKSESLAADPSKTAALLAEAVLRLADRDRKAVLVTALLEA